MFDNLQGAIAKAMVRAGPGGVRRAALGHRVCVWGDAGDGTPPPCAHARFSAQVPRICDKLGSEGRIVAKPFGKASIYWPDQAQYGTKTASELEALKEEEKVRGTHPSTPTPCAAPGAHRG